MKKSYKVKIVSLIISAIFIGCNVFYAQQNKSNINKNVNKNNVAPKKKLIVKAYTQTINWGGDGKWHDLGIKNGGQVLVNYTDPYKVKLIGNYNNLKVVINSSSGEKIYEKKDFNLETFNGEFLISNSEMYGKVPEDGGSLYFEIIITESDKNIFSAKINSLPGGE